MKPLNVLNRYVWSHVGDGRHAGGYLSLLLESELYYCDELKHGFQAEDFGGI